MDENMNVVLEHLHAQHANVWREHAHLSDHELLVTLVCELTLQTSLLVAINHKLGYENRTAR